MRGRRLPGRPVVRQRWLPAHRSSAGVVALAAAPRNAVVASLICSKTPQQSSVAMELFAVGRHLEAALGISLGVCLKLSPVLFDSLVELLDFSPAFLSVYASSRRGFERIAWSRRDERRLLLASI